VSRAIISKLSYGANVQAVVIVELYSTKIDRRTLSSYREAFKCLLLLLDVYSMKQSMLVSQSLIFSLI